MFEEQRKCACCGRLPAWSEPQLLCADNRTICGDCFRLTNLGEIPMTDKNTLESMRQINSEFYLNRIKAHNDYVAFCNKPDTQVVLNGYLLINKNDKTFAIGQNSKEGMLVGFQTASYADINNINVDDSIQTKTIKTRNAQSGAAEALMGGLFFGTVGAIVGGLAGRTEASYGDVKGADNIGFTVTYNNTSHEYFNVLKTCLNREFVNYESEKEWFDFAKELTVMICDILNELVNNTQQKQIGNTNANNFLSSGVNVNINPNNIEPTINRIEMYIEDGEWERAAQYCEAGLDYFPKDHRLYLYSLFAAYQVDNIDMLLNTADINDLEGDSRYKRILRFGDDTFVDDFIRKTDERKKEITIKEKLIAEQKDAENRKIEEAKQNAQDEFKKYIELKRNSYKLLDGASFDIGGRVNMWDPIEGTIGRKIDGQLYTGEMKLQNSLLEKDAFVSSDRCRLFLLKDGTARYNGRKLDVSSWDNLVDVAVGYTFACGLKADGTVVVTGKPPEGNLDVVSSWKDIIQIETGSWHIVGLKADGTVVAAGNNICNQCDVTNWEDMASVYAGHFMTIGLKKDGTVVAAGAIRLSEGTKIKSYKLSPESIKAFGNDIVDVSVGNTHIALLKSNGTVITTGKNDFGQCNTKDWKDIIEIVSGGDHTIGLRKDGRVVATGKNDKGQCNVSGWKLFDNYDTLKEILINKEEYRKQMIEEKKDKEERRIKDLILRLNDERRKLEEELPNVKGLFANSKKNQIMERLQEIESELDKYKE